MSQAGDVESMLADDPYCGFLGVEVARDTDGVTPGPLAVPPDLVLSADEHHIGNRHTLGMHGGVVAAFLETAGRLHVAAATGQSSVTLTFTTEFLREVRGGEVRARTEILRKGRRLAMARVTAWQEDPTEPSATGHGTFALAPPPG